MTPPPLGITEFAVLGLLDEGPSHGFALSKQLDSDAEVGRIYTVSRPLVYRALDRLVQAGLAQPVTTEKGRSGPKRVIHRITPDGRRQLGDWLAEPVEHVRDLRIGFLLKLTLSHRSGRSPMELIRHQRVALDDTLSALDDTANQTGDPVELWRRHQAAAAGAYLEALESTYSGQ